MPPQPEPEPEPEPNDRARRPSADERRADAALVGAASDVARRLREEEAAIRAEAAALDIAEAELAAHEARGAAKDEEIARITAAEGNDVEEGVPHPGTDEAVRVATAKGRTQQEHAAAAKTRREQKKQAKLAQAAQASGPKGAAVGPSGGVDARLARVLSPASEAAAAEDAAIVDRGAALHERLAVLNRSSGAHEGVLSQSMMLNERLTAVLTPAKPEPATPVRRDTGDLQAEEDLVALGRELGAQLSKVKGESDSPPKRLGKAQVRMMVRIQLQIESIGVNFAHFCSRLPHSLTFYSHFVQQMRATSQMPGSMRCLICTTRTAPDPWMIRSGIRSYRVCGARWQV